MVQRPVQQAQQPAQAPAEPQAPAAGQPSLDNIVALLQQALGPQQAAAQPAAQPAAQVPDGNPTWAQGKLGEFDTSKIEDPIIRSMANVMQAAGKDLDLDRVLGKALAHGDVGLIDAAYLQEKAGANAANLLEIARGIVQAVEAKSTAITQSVYAAVGGEAQWSTSVAAFNKAAPEALRVTVAQMLDSTNEKAIMAGAKIVAEFGKASGLLPQAAGLVNTAAGAANAAQGLSKAQFQEELRKLDPNARDYEQSRQALFTRRSLGKSVGL